MTSLLKTRPVGCCLGQRRPVFAFKAANLVHQRALRLQVLYATPEGQQQQQQGPPQQRPGGGAGGGYRQGQGAGGGGSFRPGPGGGGGGSYRPGPGGGSGGSYRPGQGGGTGGPYRSNQGGGGPGGAFRPGPGGGGGGGAFRTSQGIGVRTVPRPGPGGGAASSDEDSYGGGRRRYGGDRRGGRRGANETLVPINTAIRATEVRVIGEDKEQKGVMSLTVALDMAKDLEVDLVLVVPDASPPVCRLIQYSKYKYELDKADKDKKKAQRESRIDTKELKLRPNTDTHDYEVKVRQAQKFLSKGDRVKVTLQFKGREMEHNQVGKDMFARLVQDLGPEAVVEQPPAFQGRSMNMTLAPKKATVV